MEGAEPPAEYPRGYSVQKTTPLSRKLNELSESVSFDSEFTLAFEIQPLKIDFFFLMPSFETIPVLNGLSKSIALVEKSKIAVLLKILLIFK